MKRTYLIILITTLGIILIALIGTILLFQQSGYQEEKNQITQNPSTFPEQKTPPTTTVISPSIHKKKPEITQTEQTGTSISFSYLQNDWEKTMDTYDDAVITETITHITNTEDTFTISVARTQPQKNTDEKVGRQLIPMKYHPSDFEVIATRDGTEYLVSVTGVTDMSYSDNEKIPTVIASDSAVPNIPYYVYQKYPGGISTYLTINSEKNVLSYMDKTEIFYTFKEQDEDKQQQEWGKNKKVIQQILESIN